MKRHAAALVMSLSLASTAALAAGGAVDVAFTAPDRYTDIGFGAGEQKSNLASLSDELEKLGKRYLEPSQQLKVEVLDVDLAGRIPPNSVRDFRVMTGRADWPRIKLRWTLQSNGESKSGEETLSDMDYLQRPGIKSPDTLPYERRMLDDWFKSRFVAAPDPR
jgi:hypothetical protein